MSAQSKTGNICRIYAFRNSSACFELCNRALFSSAPGGVQVCVPQHHTGRYTDASIMMAQALPPAPPPSCTEEECHRRRHSHHRDERERAAGRPRVRAQAPLSAGPTVCHASSTQARRMHTQRCRQAAVYTRQPAPPRFDTSPPERRLLPDARLLTGARSRAGRRGTASPDLTQRGGNSKIFSVLTHI